MADKGKDRLEGLFKILVCETLENYAIKSIRKYKRKTQIRN